MTFWENYRYNADAMVLFKIRLFCVPGRVIGTHPFSTRTDAIPLSNSTWTLYTSLIGFDNFADRRNWPFPAMTKPRNCSVLDTLAVVSMLILC